MFQVKIDDNADLIPHCNFQQNVKVPFCQKYRCWSPRNALLVCRHRICFWFKYRSLEPWKMCYQYTVNEFVCSLSTALNTGTLSSKNALPVYRHLICLRLQVPVEMSKLRKFLDIIFFSIFYIKNELLDTLGVSK